MGELRLHALSITEVRDMFGATPELAARLRAIAGETFRVPAVEPQHRGLLGRLGPLVRRSGGPVFPDGMPLPSDWENLIAGRYIAPDRVDVSWRVLDAWIDALDWGTHTFNLSPAQLDGFDFALTKAGLPSQFGLRKLLAADAQLGIRPGTDMRTGYAKNLHVETTAAELEQVVDDVEVDHRSAALELLDFLRNFPAWTAEAAEQGRPAPDLFVIWWEKSRS